VSGGVATTLVVIRVRVGGGDMFLRQIFPRGGPLIFVEEDGRGY
jgi:hypothetical protein